MLEVEKKECELCKQIKYTGQFAKIPSNHDGLDKWCKTCRNRVVITKQKLIEYLALNGLEFDEDMWEKSLKIAEDSTRHSYTNLVDEKYEKIFEMRAVRAYLKLLSAELFRDSSNSGFITRKEDAEYEQRVMQYYNCKIEDVPKELIAKWGIGHKPYEYFLFEEKFQQLRHSYNVKTAMHLDHLLTYCRFRVKEEQATARGDVKEAREWARMADDIANAGKLQPAQMSKADLQSGLDTFGQLVRMVEEAVDIIPILPQFKKMPRDDVDFTLWCYINYVRDLKGLPPCSYEEVYNFYEERKKEYDELIKRVDEIQEEEY